MKGCAFFSSMPRQRLIFRIFRDDLHRLSRNVVALVVILGITVLPCLYAWFNIAASWDPYGQTGSLQVAVACSDLGYTGDIVPLHVNLGEQVLAALRKNNQLGWTFTSESAALDGVKSGKYYAAIVITENFSQNLMSLLSEHPLPADIRYYSNAKENAISPIVTAKGADAVETRIHQVFVKTVSDSLLVAMDTLSKMGDRLDADRLAQNLSINLQKMSNDLNMSADGLASLVSLLESTEAVTAGTSELFSGAQSHLPAESSHLKELNNTLVAQNDTLHKKSDALIHVLDDMRRATDRMEKSIDDAFVNGQAQAQSVGDSLQHLAQDEDARIARLTILRNRLSDHAQSHPFSAELLKPLIEELNQTLNTETKLKEALSDGADTLATGKDHAREAQRQLKSGWVSHRTRLDQLEKTYKKDVLPQLDQLCQNLQQDSQYMTQLVESLQEKSGDFTVASQKLSEQLNRLSSQLTKNQQGLRQVSAQLSQGSRAIQSWPNRPDARAFSRWSHENHEHIANFLAAPVQLKTETIYPIANFGTAMTPFYSLIALWVGGIVLVAMLQTVPLPESLVLLEKPRLSELYLARLLLFLLLGWIQSTLTAVGNLYYLDISAAHSILFLLATWIAGLVFVAVIYTLALSFGDVGKAISVVLLVVQVAGSGGTFPIEVTPFFFQKVHALLPFTPALSAMREAIGGLYEHTYWHNLATLLLFFAAALMLGLVLRRPIIRFNHFVSEKLEDSHLM